MTDLITLARSLLEAARKATKGDWWIIDPDSTEALSGTHAVALGDRRAVVFENAEENVEQDENDAAYIALCSPDAIAQLAEWSLALLRENDRLEDRNYFERSTRCRHNAKAIERAEQQAARLRQALRQMLEREHAHAEGSHVENCGSVLDRAALGKP